MSVSYILFFFFNYPATPDIHTLSLHHALPIPSNTSERWRRSRISKPIRHPTRTTGDRDGKSTRLNSSHANTSYAVFCLKKKKKKNAKMSRAAKSLGAKDQNNSPHTTLHLHPKT